MILFSKFLHSLVLYLMMFYILFKFACWILILIHAFAGLWIAKWILLNLNKYNYQNP